MPKLEKKSETLEVRLPHSVKTTFMEKCVANEETASHVLRRFIANYLKPPLRTRRGFQAVFLASALCIFCGGLYYVAQPGAPKGGMLFANFDTNKDGYLTATDARNETRPMLFAMLEKADTNEDGRLSRAEIDKVTKTTISFRSNDSVSNNILALDKAHTFSFNVKDDQDIYTQLRDVQNLSFLSDIAVQDMADELIVFTKVTKAP